MHDSFFSLNSYSHSISSKEFYPSVKSFLSRNILLIPYLLSLQQKYPYKLTLKINNSPLDYLCNYYSQLIKRIHMYYKFWLSWLNKNQNCIGNQLMGPFKISSCICGWILLNVRMRISLTSILFTSFIYIELRSEKPYSYNKWIRMESSYY